MVARTIAESGLQRRRSCADRPRHRIELTAPIRAKNLAGLRLDRHLIRSRPNLVPSCTSSFRPERSRTRTPLEFELPPDAVRLLELYLKKFRPLLVTDGSSYLFPARKGGAKTPAQLAEQIKRAIKIGAGLTVNATFSGICAPTYTSKPIRASTRLCACSSATRTLTVTVRAYCGLERSDAVRRYDRLIDAYRGPPKDESHDS